MSLKITWTNPNTISTKTRIYRSTTAINSSSPGTPLVELINNETSYIDTTAVNGNTYYYALSSKTDATEVFTPNYQITVGDNRGAGPNALTYGDLALGYYGLLTSDQFISTATLYSIAKNKTGIPSTLIRPQWYKFARNGKILYLPDQFLGTATWTDLYNAGMVYGVDANAPTGVDITGLTPMNQNTTFSYNGQVYRVRLMRGWEADYTASAWDWTTATSDTIAAFDYCEFTDLIYSMIVNVPDKQRTPNWLNNTLEQYVGYATNYTKSDVAATQTTLSAAGGILCQERNATTATNCLVRARRDVLNSSNGSTQGDFKLLASHMGVTGITTSRQWVPVIELVDGVLGL